MLVDHIIPTITPKAGGTTKSVLTMCSALAMIDGTEIRLITQLDKSRETAKPSSPLVQLSVADYRETLSCKLGLEARKHVNNNIQNRRPDLVHSNGIWSLMNHWSVRAAQRHRIPLICQPHGMLSPWALKYKRLKKYLALRMYQRRDLALAALLVATSEMEAEQLRELGLTQPIAIVPNGIDASNNEITPSTFIKNKKQFRRVLFVGRIHPMKGLINLVEAWSRVSSDDWILQLAGPDEVGHLAEVFARAKKLGIEKRIQYLGFVEEKDRESVYHQADLVVLPSFSENFSMVIVEALTVGKPVITTKATPWADLEIYECGWCVDPTIEGIAKALNIVVNASPDKLIKMGISAKTYASRYHSDLIAKKMHEVYCWVIDTHAKPTFCHLS
jgi:glycosyltransferase involved in cell wall biosynthesis